MAADVLQQALGIGLPMDDQEGDQDGEGQEDRAREEKLLAAIGEYESSATGNEADPMSVDRAAAIQYYLGQPFGNEVEGRSQVVSKDTFDTIEWIKPALLRVFAGGDQIAEFSPEAEDDIEGAQQESDYIDFIIQRKNRWFSIANEWFTDALMTRNAYCLAYWESESEAKLERYQGLTDDQLTLIGLDQSVQIVAHEAYPAPMPIPHQQAMGAISQGVLQAFPQVMLHNIEVRRTKNYGCVRMTVLPPERCLVDGETKSVSVRDSNFFEYWEYKTISSLRADGFDIPDDISDEGGTQYGLVDQVRDSPNRTAVIQRQKTTDPAMRLVRAQMIWMKFDYDGDGIAEHRYVMKVGSNILLNQEVTCTPIATIVPYPMPHRHIGLSVSDVVADIQVIKSAMQRQVIDNAFLSNNQQVAVDKNRVNLDDMTTSRPGNIIRVDGPPAEGIMPFATPPTAMHGIEVLNYFDGIREERAGVSKPFAGADLDAIQAQPGTIAQLTSAASQKMEQIARIFAEGVRELFEIVHELTLTHATVEDKVQLRGKWVTIDPRTWKKRNDMHLLVGIGVGNRQQHAAAVAALLGVQEKAMGVGLSSREKIYNALGEYTKALGFASAKQFFDEPDPAKPFQPQPPYQIIVAQIKAQADTLIEQMQISGNTQIATLREEAAAARTYFETTMQAQSDAQDRFVRAVSEATDRMQELRLEGVRTAGEGRSTNINIDGSGVADTVRQAVDAAAASSKKVEEVVAALEQMKQERAKPQKRIITSPSGKKYTVEEAS